MAPLGVMSTVTALTRAAGAGGRWAQSESWRTALCVGLAAMFVVTALSHFHPRGRPDLGPDGAGRAAAAGASVTITTPDAPGEHTR